MNDMIQYQFDQEPVRVVLVVEDPWWVANDIAKVLGYRGAPNMTRLLDEDEKGTHIVSTLGGRQELSIISESGLFAAILKSRKPEAKRFRRWVTGEVLPSLRRHGRYTMHDEPAPTLYDPTHLSAGVAVVREARRLFGIRAARAVWIKIGLPTPIAMPSGLPSDELAQPLCEWLSDKRDCTIEEAALGIGFKPHEIDDSMRYRIGSILRTFGWYPKKRRIDARHTANVFSPNHSPEEGPRDV